MRKAIILFLFVLTVLNLSAFLIPQLCGEYCYCINNGEITCTGDCCFGTPWCNCYDDGTDTCFLKPRI
jgi:hypothetical protein